MALFQGCPQNMLLPHFLSRTDNCLMNHTLNQKRGLIQVKTHFVKKRPFLKLVPLTALVDGTSPLTFHLVQGKR